tara:strand:- start:64 stop:387 length:324 start_codon:yes stop_codon:yes gene_type:complete
MKDDNVEWISIEEKMVKKLLDEKQKEYGSFDNNSYIISNYIQSELEVVNGFKIKVPTDIVPRLMIVLKLTRTIDDGSGKDLYKLDTHKDIAGYNNLLKDMLLRKRDN